MGNANLVGLRVALKVRQEICSLSRDPQREQPGDFKLTLQHSPAPHSSRIYIRLCLPAPGRAFKGCRAYLVDAASSRSAVEQVLIVSVAPLKPFAPATPQI